MVFILIDRSTSKKLAAKDRFVVFDSSDDCMKAARSRGFMRGLSEVAPSAVGQEISYKGKGVDITVVPADFFQKKN